MPSAHWDPQMPQGQSGEGAYTFGHQGRSWTSEAAALEPEEDACIWAGKSEYKNRGTEKLIFTNGGHHVTYVFNAENTFGCRVLWCVNNDNQLLS